MWDLNIVVFDVVEKLLENVYLSKGLDKVLSKVDKVWGFVNDIVDCMVKSIGDSVNGFVDSIIVVGKVVVYGYFGEVLGDIGFVVGNVVQLVLDLMLEGLVVSVVVVILQKIYLGGMVVDLVVEGVFMGGCSGLKDVVKFVVKEGIKVEVGVQVQNLFDKVSGNGNGNGDMLFGVVVVGVGVVGDFYVLCKNCYVMLFEVYYIGM